jgi:apolipoprotein N-acyltransferase
MLVALTTAGLYALAQPPWGVAPLATVALVPWLVATVHRDFARAMALGLLVGTLAGCASTPWVPAALAALGASPLRAGLGFVAAGVWVHGLAFAAVGALVRGLRSASPWARIAATALVFLALDALRLAGAWSLPWALLGHSQGSVLGVAQLAVVGGVPLLSALLAAVNQAAAIAWETRGERAALRRCAALATAWLALALLGLPIAEQVRAPRTDERRAPSLRLLLVQPAIPRGERWAPELQGKHLARMIDATSKALLATSPPPDAILWPENLLTTRLEQVPALAAELRAAVDRFGVPLLLGAVRSANHEGRYRSSVLWLEPGRRLVASLDKQRAVPLLEAAPRSRLAETATRWLAGAGAGPRVEEAAAGDGAVVARSKLAPVLCFEALFPALVASRRQPGTLAVVNLADDGWVEAEAATPQLVAFASFRAVEQRLPLVRVAHGGLSAAVDAYGRRILSLPLDAWADASVELHEEAPPSLAERAALLALPLASGAGVGWGLAAWARRPRRASGGAAHA